MSLLSSIFGDEGSRILKRLRPIVASINAFEEELSSLSNEELSQKTDVFRKQLADGKTLNDILSEAFAVVREVSKRVSGERHYDVQLLGGITLHNGNIAEMRTGEGKTLVATLPAYLNALTGEGVHIVTVNDYLSRRDAVWMGQIYAFLGLSVGVINSDASYIYDPEHKEGSIEDQERDQTGSYKIQYEFLRPCTRRDAYAQDITYGTNNEFGFDYLRDNIEYDVNNIRQRKHAYAVVDEIDSILIDEARTPLIISAPSAESGDLYATFAGIARKLVPNEDYEVDEKQRAIQLTDSGIEKAEHALGVTNIYTEKGIKYVHHLETAVRAKALFERDKEYVVRDGKVIIVDEFTGRLQPGRRWSEGLHQAIEAKEGVPVERESRTFASITFQNYFRMYEKLSGMTGTAITSQEEFYSVYKLETVAVPTHRPNARTDHNDLIFQTENGKFKALARRVKELHEKGQPVLIGTVSIEKNEQLSEYLRREGIPHVLLNAKNHEQEGEIIAGAGARGKVTVATNLAGRGVDIKLGGVTADKGAYEEVKAFGGLFVIGTERHEARRIDDQLRGRSGRQGDPGETQFFVSLGDSLMRIFATDVVKGMMGRFNIPEDEPIENAIITRALESAQKKIEGFHFDARKHILLYDDVLNRQRESIYAKRRSILFGTDSDVASFLESIAESDEEKQAIQAKKEELGDTTFFSVVRRLILQTVDMLWMEHLEVMDYMRGSVNLRAYGQRDPFIEYRKEGLRLFQELEAASNEQILRLVPNIAPGIAQEREGRVEAVHARPESISSTTSSGKQEPVRTGKKIGRNEIVTITNGTETMQMKYKKAEPLIASGEWKLL